MTDFKIKKYDEIVVGLKGDAEIARERRDGLLFTRREEYYARRRGDGEGGGGGGTTPTPTPVLSFAGIVYRIVGATHDNMIWYAAAGGNIPMDVCRNGAKFTSSGLGSSGPYYGGQREIRRRGVIWTTGAAFDIVETVSGSLFSPILDEFTREPASGNYNANSLELISIREKNNIDSWSAWSNEIAIPYPAAMTTYVSGTYGGSLVVAEDSAVFAFNGYGDAHPFEVFY